MPQQRFRCLNHGHVVPSEFDEFIYEAMLKLHEQEASPYRHILCFFPFSFLEKPRHFGRGGGWSSQRNCGTGSGGGGGRCILKFEPVELNDSIR